MARGEPPPSPRASALGAPLTPVMRQYQALKHRYPDYLLLFRLGDFYEMFFDDAVLGARLLQITLTSRQKGPGAIPMAGIPHHAADTYIARLLRAGQKVAVCEQMEAPGRGRKLIRREIVRVITPGTVSDTAFLDGEVNNFLLTVSGDRRGVGVALVDVTTGDFWVGEEAGAGRAILEATLLRRPAEILVRPSLLENEWLARRLRESGATLTLRDRASSQGQSPHEALSAHFKVLSLGAFGLDQMSWGIEAAAVCLDYLRETQGDALGHLTRLQPLTGDQAMVLDEAAVRTLELLERVQDRSARGSLYGTLNRTLTPMGARLLRQWLLRPLLDPTEIARRQDGIQAFVEAPALRASLRSLLGSVGDLERFTSRAAMGTAHARDLIGLRAALAPLPAVKSALGAVSAPLVGKLAEEMAELEPLRKLLEDSLEENSPAGLHDGGLIRESWSQSLADLKREAREAREWIAGLESRERQRARIASLRVRFNRVFGYSIEISNAHLKSVPEEYIRRQTLVGSERFVTPALKEYEAKVLGAEERIRQLDFELFEEIRASVAREALALLRTARAVGALDLLVGLAAVAQEGGYIRPQVDLDSTIHIVDGRHPVLETMTEQPFVPNDLLLDGHETQLVILTGPNMAGKSTYMRQVALIVILAQMGAFVPAREARIGVVDRIFTRVGAQDHLSKGQSTFLVEMVETANILHNATRRSLILLDEVGRGTSTFDGLAIAWATAEHLHDANPGAKVLFATHYHELTRLAEGLPRVKNFHVAVREWNDEIVFLHKVRPGGTDRSYGIQVARLAGLPASVLERAKGLLAALESGRGDLRVKSPAALGPAQLPLFAQADAVLAELAELEVARLTPIQALNLLAGWQERVRKPQ